MYIRGLTFGMFAFISDGLMGTNPLQVYLLQKVVDKAPRHDHNIHSRAECEFPVCLQGAECTTPDGRPIPVMLQEYELAKYISTRERLELTSVSTCVVVDLANGKCNATGIAQSYRTMMDIAAPKPKAKPKAKAMVGHEAISAAFQLATKGKRRFSSKTRTLVEDWGNDDEEEIDPEELVDILESDFLRRLELALEGKLRPTPPPADHTDEESSSSSGEDRILKPGKPPAAPHMGSPGPPFDPAARRQKRTFEALIHGILGPDKYLCTPYAACVHYMCVPVL